MKREFLVGYALVGPEGQRHTSRSFVECELSSDQLVTKNIIINMEISVMNEWREMGLEAQHVRIFTFQEINR